jgi:hypothetical protein
MKPQLFVSSEYYNPKKFKPVKNREYINIPKPYNGLWTSTYRQDIKSEWVQFCLDEFTSAIPHGGWRGSILIPYRDAKIYTIDSYDDLVKLFNKYQYIPNSNTYFIKPIFLDFEAISKDYDAIHLTKKGEWETRYTTPNLYGWDVESTLWFRDCFEKVINIRIPTKYNEVIL